MSNVNTRNYGIATGRLIRDPVVNLNKDGSRIVQFTLSAPRNFKNKNGNRDCDYIPLEAFVPSRRDDLGIFGLIRKDDLITAAFTIHSWIYTDFNGNVQHKTNLLVQSIDLLEAAAKAPTHAAGTLPSEPAKPSATPSLIGSTDSDLPF